MKNTKKHLLKTTTVLLLFTFGTLFPMYFMNFGVNSLNQDLHDDITNPDNDNGISLQPSDAYQVDSQLSPGISWWNDTWSRRIGIEIENNEVFNRYEPVDIYLTFEANSFYKGTERLVRYDGGSEVWSDPIPIQLYNTTGATYYTSFNVVFIANVSQNSNSTFFLYYHVSGDGIDTSYSYETGFESTNMGGTLNVEVKREDLIPDVNDYKLILKVGEAASTLVKGTGSGWSTANYHAAKSLAPERIETKEALSSLVFSAHLDETSGTTVSAHNYAGTIIEGTVTSSISDLTVLGVTNGAFNFRGTSNDMVRFSDALAGTGAPFNTGTVKWSMACWVNPTTLTAQTTGKGIQNPFMAHTKTTGGSASRYTFEIGISTSGYIMLYFRTQYGPTVYYTFDLLDQITEGNWHFIAIRVDLTPGRNGGLGSVGVCVDDTWQYTSNWDSGNQMRSDTTSFQIGGSLNGGRYFNGKVDEVQFYSSNLDETSLDTTYKYSSNPEIVHTSTISSIQDVEVGDVFSQYNIIWNAIGNMWTSDIVTFYWDYNLWNIQRTIYFQNLYEQTGYGITNGPMIPLNSYYDVSNTVSSGSYYVYEGNYYQDLSDPSNVVEPEDFIVIYCEPNDNDDAFGIFLQDWTVIGGATMNYFNGTLSYASNIVEFAAGANHDFSNAGGDWSSKKLTIKFWEFIDSIYYGDYGSDMNEIKSYFDDVSISLKTQTNQYIYNPQDLRYNIAVYVTDHDDTLVPGVTIDLINETGSIIDTRSTDTSGNALFQDIMNGTYTVNASYTDFGKTIEIANVIPIDDLAAESNPFTKTFIANFSRVNMTSIHLNCSRIVDGEWVSPLNNARFNFTYSRDGLEEEMLIGYKYTNETGAVMFRWQNATLDGYVSVSIFWYEGWELNLQAENEIPNMDSATLKLYFNNYTWYEVNATKGEGEAVTYISSITLYDIDYNYVDYINVDIEDSFTIVANYSYAGSDGTSGPVEGGIIMNLKILTTKVNINPIAFEYNGSGIYTLTMDTSDPIETGGQAWKAGIDYIAEIIGADGTENDTLAINLQPYQTRISANELYSNANYLEMLSFNITYEYNSSGIWTAIPEASLSYYVVGYGYIYGTSLPYLGGGTYTLSINTTNFPETGQYYIQISASKQNYQTRGHEQRVVILDISAKLNNSEITFQYESNVYLGETEVFDLFYTEAISGKGIEGADIVQYDWWKFIDGVKADEGSGNLDPEGEGMYSLDFNTAALEVGRYVFEISIKKTNYELKRATINLNINKRDFSSTALPFYSAVSGVPGGLEIKICLKDALSGEIIDDISPGMMTITFLGQTFNFTHLGDGCYRTLLTNIPGGVLVTPQLYGAVIRIERENYTTIEQSITINVALMELFPGMPLFYFLIIIIGAVAVVSGIVAYRVIQVRRIPKFIKKSKNLIKAISSEDTISDSLMYPTKEAFIAKKFADNWKIHDLSLFEIMGVGKGKKVKTLPGEKLKDAKGGAE